jgi:hypothetical protein
MSVPRLGLTVVGMLLLASGGFAQGVVDVSRLPIDLERIQRKLQASSVHEDHHGLNLRYVVEVYGRAPAIVFFGPKDDLLHGPVPNTAPTHQDMIEQVTPREYRTPVADLGALVRWLADQAKK